MGLWNLSSTPFHKALSPNEGKALIKQAYRKGIRYFDTAYSYGDAESMLAGAMRELGRDDFHVISKVMPVPSAERKAETILRRIGREYADVLLIHWPSCGESLFKALRTLEKLKENGKALAIGVSNFPLPLLESICSDFCITFHERPLSLIWTRDWKEEKKLGLNTLAYAPLGMGILSGRYRAGEDPGDARARLAAISSPSLEKLLEAIGHDPATALSWVYGEKPFGVISGYSRMEDLDILDRIGILSENKREELEALAAEITAAEPSDNIFSHNWRSDACTT